MILPTCQALIHSSWTSIEKTMDNLVFGQFEHLIENITYRINFLMQFSDFFKKIVGQG